MLQDGGPSACSGHGTHIRHVGAAAHLLLASHPGIGKCDVAGAFTSTGVGLGGS
jgi:hypothetical protein